MIKAIAVDDEPPALRVVETFCGEISFVDLQKSFTMPREALQYVQQYPVDLLFLDINMASLSGIDFYKKAKQDTMVIFTTAHSEYAIEGFNLSAVDYLLKPFTLERFTQAVHKAHEYYQYTHQATNAVNQFLYVRADYSLVKVPISDILYIEGLDDYLKIHIHNQKTVVARATMKGILEKLPAREFMRVHRSFIIPFSKIENVRNKMISIAGHEIPIGVSYEEKFFQLLKG